MGRPKGSKNKQKIDISPLGEVYVSSSEVIKWQSQKEKTQQAVETVEQTVKSVRQKKTRSAICSKEKRTDLLSGSDSVEIATKKMEEDKESENQLITGWITINLSPATKSNKEWYYTGGDIHDTKEDAMKITATNRIAVAKIEFQPKRRI